jgi:hypothetical protein
MLGYTLESKVRPLYQGYVSDTTLYLEVSVPAYICPDPILYREVSVPAFIRPDV